MVGGGKRMILGDLGDDIMMGVYASSATGTITGIDNQTFAGIKVSYLISENFRVSFKSKNSPSPSQFSRYIQCVQPDYLDS